MKYRVDYSGVKDFNTKKEADKFIKKETYEVRRYLKYNKKRKCFIAGQIQRYPYGKVIF